MIENQLLGLVLLLVTCFSGWSSCSHMSCFVHNSTCTNDTDFGDPEFKRLGPRGFQMTMPVGRGLGGISMFYRRNAPINFTILHRFKGKDTVTFGVFMRTLEQFYYTDYFIKLANTDVLHLFIMYHYDDGGGESDWPCLSKLCTINMTYYSV